MASVTYTIGENSADDFSGSECLCVRGGANSGSNYDGQWAWQADRAVDDNDGKVLVRFDLSPLVGSNVTGASLWLTYSATGGNRNSVIITCDRNWTKATVTWDKYDGSNAWSSTALYGGHGEDVAIEAGQFSGAALDVPVEFPGDGTALVDYLQDVVNGDDGAPTNWASFVVRPDGPGINIQQYYAQAHADGFRPYLEIEIEAGPEAPTVTVTDVQANQCVVTGSAFVAGPAGGTHVSTNYYIRKASDDSLVTSESTSVAGELLSKTIGPILTNSTQYAEMEYVDSNGVTGDLGTSANFVSATQDSCFRDGIIDHNDTGLTKIGVLSPDPYSYYLPLGNVLDDKLIAFYYGEVNRPRGLLINDCDPHIDAWATALGGFDGEVASGYHGIYGYSWAKYWSIEYNGLGCWLLASGDITNLTGIFGYLRLGIPWPYGTCGVSREPGEVNLNHSMIEVDIWEDGVRVHSERTLIPALTYAVNRACGQFTKYGIRLQAVRDLSGDPTGNTWDIKCQYEEGAEPDGSTWTTEFAYTSSVLGCGRGGAGFQLFPGASGGPSGAMWLERMEVQNLSDYCVPPVKIPGETQPTCVATANCGFLNANASGWSGAAVGPTTEAKWDVRLTSDDSLLYTTGWQSVYLEGFQVNLFDEPTIPHSTAVYVQATLKDADGTTSTITPGCSVTTGSPPVEPTVVIKGIFLNRVIVTTGAFSSTDATATHYQTTISVYLATDTELETVLVSLTNTTPDQLTGEFSLDYAFEEGVLYAVQVIYVDQYGCTSTALTTDGYAESKAPPNKICPVYAACVVSGEGSYTTCALGADPGYVPYVPDEGSYTVCTMGVDPAYVADSTDEAEWDGDCAENC